MEIGSPTEVTHYPDCQTVRWQTTKAEASWTGAKQLIKQAAAIFEMRCCSSGQSAAVSYWLGLSLLAWVTLALMAAGPPPEIDAEVTSNAAVASDIRR
jgi:hypothetical protein